MLLVIQTKKFKLTFIIFSILVIGIIYFSYFKNENNFIIETNQYIDLNYDKGYYYPTEYREVSSPYGYRILYGTNNFHDGIDFLAPQGSEVKSFSSGYVSYCSFMQGYGNTIIITHENGLKSLYGHLSEQFIVHNGQYVNANQIIGYVGPKILSNGISNGNTTGPHLHFTIFENDQTINPYKYL